MSKGSKTSKTSGSRKRNRPSKAERLEAARRRAQRRRIAYGLAAVAAVGVIVAFALAGGDGGDGAGPSQVADVRVLGPARSQPLQAGEAVPDFSAPGLDGGTISWSDYEGAPTVLSVWASWCPHCQVELPVLAAVAADHPGVRLTSVTTAIGENPGPSPEQYMRDEGLSFPVAVDDSDNTLFHAFGIEGSGFPTTYYVGADGRVVETTVGEVDEQATRQLFKMLEQTA